jgi:Dimethlysulfonioproprionate lyase
LTHADPARALLEAVLAFYAERAGGEGGDVLAVARQALARAAGFAPIRAPRTLAASALLAPALNRMKDAPLAAAIEAAAPLFRWRQNPNYTAGSMGADFMAGYGYVEFAGPKEALFQAAQLRVGLLLLAAGVHYPLHAHPAEEVYHPLTDDGLWRRGDEPWRSVPAGAAIYHPPMMPHETKAKDGTLLALYCWRGDTATEARLTA